MYKDEDQAVYEKLMNDTFPGLTMFVRDVNLNIVCAEMYQPGMFLHERGFTDATKRVMGMITSHRFAILSNHMADLSLFEHGTNWGLCVAKNGSHFKVLDVYEYEALTQILLLHLPDDDRWDMFQHTKFSIEDQLVETSRARFRNKALLAPVPELTTNEWLNRCAEPLGMDEHGNLFDL